MHPLLRGTLWPTHCGLLLALPLVGLLLAGSGCLKPYCTSDTDCPLGQRCNLSANRCETLDSDARVPDGGDGGDGGAEDGSAGDGATPCQESTSCTDPKEPICDPETHLCRPCLEGTDGHAECTEKDGNSPLCHSGSCVECIDSVPHCQGSESGPICDPETHQCRPCGSDATGDAECLALGLDLPVCHTAAGQCVECTDSIPHCQGSESGPICDQETHACRACASHTECQAPMGVGVCQLTTGQCLSEDNVIFVDAFASNCPGDGTMQSPFCVLQDGVDDTNLLRHTLLVANGTYDRIMVQDKQVTLVADGPNVIITPVTNSVHVVAVSSVSADHSTSLTVDGLTIQDGGAGGIGLHCSTGSVVQPRVHFTRSIISTNSGGGISANNCIVTVEESAIFANSNHGISANNCTVTVEKSAIIANTDRGISATQCALTLDSNTISQNTGGGVYMSSSVFTVMNNFIVLNGTITSDFGGVQMTEPSTGSLFEFNTVADNMARNEALIFAGILCLSTSAFTISNSIVYQNHLNDLSTTCVCENCHLTDNGDPLFLGGDDYHLQTGSPCIDAADPASTLGHDIDGDPRPLGSGYDIGADEAG